MKVMIDTNIIISAFSLDFYSFYDSIYVWAGRKIWVQPKAGNILAMGLADCLGPTLDGENLRLFLYKV